MIYSMEISLEHNKSLKELTTLQVGGTAQQYVVVRSEQELDTAVTYANKENISITILGGGSNVLVAQAGIQGLVIHMKIAGIESKVQGDVVMLTVGAGEALDEVVQYTVDNGYWGIENLSHIPGFVGAAPVQNVGAYGREVQEVIESVRVYNTQEQKFEMLTAAECLFGYRDSLFKKEDGKKYIVVAVTFILTTVVTPCLTYRDLKDRFIEEDVTLPEIREAVIEIRSKKFPDWKTVGTAGSFFKNPVIPEKKFEELSVKYPDLPSFPAGDGLVKVPLGWVLDKVLHLKGEGTEKVGTYKGQALVLINRGDATADEIKLFADTLIQKVYDEIGVKVEWEVTKLGF